MYYETPTLDQEAINNRHKVAAFEKIDDEATKSFDDVLLACMIDAAKKERSRIDAFDLLKIAMIRLEERRGHTPFLYALYLIKTAYEEERAWEIEIQYLPNITGRTKNQLKWRRSKWDKELGEYFSEHHRDISDEADCLQDILGRPLGVYIAERYESWIEKRDPDTLMQQFLLRHHRGQKGAVKNDLYRQNLVLSRIQTEFPYKKASDGDIQRIINAYKSLGPERLAAEYAEITIPLVNGIRVVNLKDEPLTEEQKAEYREFLNLVFATVDWGDLSAYTIRKKYYEPKRPTLDRIDKIKMAYYYPRFNGEPSQDFAMRLLMAVAGKDRLVQDIVLDKAETIESWIDSLAESNPSLSNLWGLVLERALAAPKH